MSTPIIPAVILPIDSSRPTRTNKRLSLVFSPPPPAPSTSIGTLEIKPKRNGRGKAKNSSGGSNGGGMNEDCSICSSKLPYSKKKKDNNVVWVECEKCETWFHWSCVALDPLDTIDTIDTWYCVPCITVSSTSLLPLTTTYKPLPRKSLREKQSIDYANFAAHLPSDVHKWVKVLETRKVVSGAFKEYKAEELNDDWLWSNEESFLEPFLIRDKAGLGMKMPAGDMGIHEIAGIVGPSTPIEVIDVASQSSLAHWTLQQWANYYTDPKRDKVRNVISLEISESPLAKSVIPPEFVRKLDWVETIWPNDLKGLGEYPRVMKYCLMSVAKCWTDWHCDFAGSSVFYHVLRGSKVFYFIRPTKENLEAYEKWSGNAERQEDTWLGDEVDVVYKIELTAGNTMIIPTGWIHAVYTPTDSLVFGGNFLHSLNIQTQLRIYEIEIATKVPRKFRFPQFVKLLWFVARHYNSQLESFKSLPPSKARTNLAMGLNPRVLKGLKSLSDFLVEQTRRFAKGSISSAERKRISRESVPSDYIKDPARLSREFRCQVLLALNEELDDDCFAPTVPTTSTGSTLPALSSPATAMNPSTPSSIVNKRKRSLLLSTPLASSPSTSTTSTKKPKIKHLKSSTPSIPKTPTTYPPDGTIITRNALPVTITTRKEQMIDPDRVELGYQWAEIRKTESSLEVVRKLGLSTVAPLSSDGTLGELEVPEGKGRIMEIRKVVTVVERVRWLLESEIRALVGPSASAIAPIVVVSEKIEEKEVEVAASPQIEQEEAEMRCAFDFVSSPPTSYIPTAFVKESILNEALPQLDSSSTTSDSASNTSNSYDFAYNPTPPLPFASTAPATQFFNFDSLSDLNVVSERSCSLNGENGMKVDQLIQHDQAENSKLSEGVGMDFEDLNQVPLALV